MKKISDEERFLDIHSFKQDIVRMYRWCQKNRFSINVKKTKVVFDPYSNAVLNNMIYEIEIDQSVHYVNSYLYLGIGFDEHLTLRTNTLL